MASIKNNTRKTITLPSMHSIPPMGTLDGITNDVLRMGDNANMLNGLARSLQVEIKYDPETIPDEGQVTASIEPNPEAVEQAKVEADLAKAAAKEQVDQAAAAAASVSQEASKPSAKK